MAAANSGLLEEGRKQMALELKRAMDEFLGSTFQKDKWLYNEEGEEVACVQYVNYDRKLIFNHSVTFQNIEEEETGDRALEKLLPGYTIIRIVFQGHEDKEDLIAFLSTIIEGE